MADRQGVAAADAYRRRSKKDEGGVTTIGADKTELGEVEKEKFTVAGKGLGKKESAFDNEPKQQPGESLASYGTRMREYRAKKRNVTMDQAGSALAGRMK